MGQLLVVARHTDTSPSSCYEPELFPDHNGQLTIVANVEELWVVFQLLLLAFVVVWDQQQATSVKQQAKNKA